MQPHSLRDTRNSCRCALGQHVLGQLKKFGIAPYTLTYTHVVETASRHARPDAGRVRPLSFSVAVNSTQKHGQVVFLPYTYTRNAHSKLSPYTQYTQCSRQQHPDVPNSDSKKCKQALMEGSCRENRQFVIALRRLCWLVHKCSKLHQR